MAGKARFSPVVAALRLSPDSATGKNAVAMSIASQQVSCARVFDRFTNVIWVKTAIISGTSVRRKKNRCNDCGSESPIPTTAVTGYRGAGRGVGRGRGVGGGRGAAGRTTSN